LFESMEKRQLIKPRRTVPFWACSNRRTVLKSHSRLSSFLIMFPPTFRRPFSEMPF
jgi:hypothetical protein